MDEIRLIELYIHIPFCVRKCLYCDFLSAPASENERKSYVRKLIEEIRVQGEYYRDCRVTSIYLGGGTPSVLNGVQIASILSAVYENFAVMSDAEISMECNPGTLTSHKLEICREAGVNRLSIGLQSADNTLLQTLGRIHTYEDFLQSYEYAISAGFKNINVDLMAGIPGQSLQAYQNTLRNVIMLRPQHISAYSLIIEEGTPFFYLNQSQGWRSTLPDEDAEREMYHETNRLLTQAGFERYEISNYAKPGFQCRHNIGYWTGTEYLGFGLGAAGYMMHRRFHVEKDLKKYMELDFASDLTGLYQEEEHLSFSELMSEFMILGLRMTEGVSGAEFLKRFGRNMYDVYRTQIDTHVADGLLTFEPPVLKLTEKGLDLANVVMRDFI